MFVPKKSGIEKRFRPRGHRLQRPDREVDRRRRYRRQRGRRHDVRTFGAAFGRFNVGSRRAAAYFDGETSGGMAMGCLPCERALSPHCRTRAKTASS
jgi:hypothetical protein